MAYGDFLDVAAKTLRNSRSPTAGVAEHLMGDTSTDGLQALAEIMAGLPTQLAAGIDRIATVVSNDP